MVLKRLTVGVKGELAPLTIFLVEIDRSFNATNFVREGDWENRGIREVNASFGEVSLVECNVNGLVLGYMLRDKHMLLPFDKELEDVESD